MFISSLFNVLFTFLQKETANNTWFLYFIFIKLLTALEALELISSGDGSDFGFSYSGHKVFIDSSEAQNETIKVSVNDFPGGFGGQNNENEIAK